MQRLKSIARYQPMPPEQPPGSVLAHRPNSAQWTAWTIGPAQVVGFKNYWYMYMGCWKVANLICLRGAVLIHMTLCLCSARRTYSRPNDPDRDERTLYSTVAGNSYLPPGRDAVLGLGTP